jgi:hypothetical protein
MSNSVGELDDKRLATLEMRLFGVAHSNVWPFGRELRLLCLWPAAYLRHTLIGKRRGYAIKLFIKTVLWILRIHDCISAQQVNMRLMRVFT